MNENISNIAVFHDDEYGIIYAPTFGTAKKTESAHAQILEMYLKKYANNDLSEKEASLLEQYFVRQFANVSELQIDSVPHLLERKTLSRIEILVANDCNLNCRYCFAKAGTYGYAPNRMNPQSAAHFLSQIIDGRYTAVERVMFFGGEPLLCPSTLRSICEFFRERVSEKALTNMPVFSIVTNGTLIDDNFASLAKEFNILITISVDGPPDINDINRIDKRGSGTFSNVKSGIDTLRRHGVLPSMIEATYTKTHQTLEYSREEIKEFLKNEFEIETIFVADCESTCQHTDLIPSVPNFNIEKECNRPYNIWRMRDALNKDSYSDFSCNAGYGSLALMPNGDIFPCHYFVTHPEYRIASFLNGSLDFEEYSNVLNKLNTVRRSTHIKCAKCWGRVACDICPAYLLFASEEVKDNYCKTEKELQKKLLLKCAGN